jgi:hypothetical protein
VIVISGGAAFQVVVAAVLFALWYLRARATARELAALRRELRALREEVAGRGAPRHAVLPTLAVHLPPPLPRAEMLALGRSLAFQLLRSERAAGSPTRVEAAAVQTYRATPEAERDVPGIVLRRVKS